MLLFRETGSEHKLEGAGVPLYIAGVWSRVYALILACAVVAGAAGVTFGTYSRKARVTGFLVPDKGLIKVLASHEGRVVERKIEEGQHVDKGAALFTIDVSGISAVGRTADLVVQNLRERRALVERELARQVVVQSAEVDHLDATIASLKKQMDGMEAELEARLDYRRLAANAYDRNRTLQTEGVYSISQSEKVEQDHVTSIIAITTLERSLATTRGDLATFEADKRGQADKQANDRSLLERTRAELDQQIFQIEEQRQLVVRATEAGTVTRLIPNVGSAVDTVTPLLTIVPDGSKLEAYLYVPSNAAGFVKVGAQVLLRYEAFPYQKFGIQKAVVTTISRTSVNAKELPFPVTSEEPLYLITSQLEKSTITAFGYEEPLNAGAKFQADLVLEDRRIWEWVIEPLLAAKSSL